MLKGMRYASLHHFNPNILPWQRKHMKPLQTHCSKVAVCLIIPMMDEVEAIGEESDYLFTSD